MAEQVELMVSPKKYYLVNRIGGVGWEVLRDIITHNFYNTLVKIDDDKLAIYIALKLVK